MKKKIKEIKKIIKYIFFLIEFLRELGIEEMKVGKYEMSLK